MNTENNIGTAVAVVTEVKPKSKAIFLAPKVKTGQCGKPGAPLKEIIGLSKNRRRGIFTKEDIFNMNGETISKLAIHQRIKRLIKAKELFKSATALKHEGRGRKPLGFTFDASKAVVKKSAKKNKTVAAEPEVAPVVAAETPVVVETPVVEMAV